MPRTPDRAPGASLEEKLILEDEGLTADAEGETVYRAGAFSMRDAIGAFNPRDGGTFDEDTILTDDVICEVMVDDILGNVMVNQ